MTSAPPHRPAVTPLTVGTAGHVDHGKTALVAALTGTHTDRLPEERARGLSIALGYAELKLPSGRLLSLVDVPGHERFVRTMIAGAGGIDFALLAIAADDGVMPQTREHLAVLTALGVPAPVVVVTKCDRADPRPATAQARVLLPAATVVAVSVRSGDGLPRLREALDRAAAAMPSRAVTGPQPPRLHVDRVFTVAGTGRVATGTLWSGRVSVGDRLVGEPGAEPLRVRGIEIHGRPVREAWAGGRVAVAVHGPGAAALAPGALITAAGTVAARRRLTVVLDGPAEAALRTGMRAQFHHGTRDAAGRVRLGAAGTAELRLERPLLALTGDRLVVRRIAPPGTLGGARVLADPPPARPCADGPSCHPADPPAPAPARLRARTAPLADEPLAQARAVIVALAREREAFTLAEARDALGIPRARTEAVLRQLDAERVTIRRGNVRVLRRGWRAGSDDPQNDVAERPAPASSDDVVAAPGRRRSDSDSDVPVPGRDGRGDRRLAAEGPRSRSGEGG